MRLLQEVDGITIHATMNYETNKGVEQMKTDIHNEIFKMNSEELESVIE